MQYFEQKFGCVEEHRLDLGGQEADTRQTRGEPGIWYSGRHEVDLYANKQEFV